MESLTHNIIENDEYIEDIIKEQRFLMNCMSTLTDPLTILYTLPANKGKRVSFYKLVPNKTYYGKCNCNHHDNSISPYWKFSIDSIQPRKDKYYNFIINMDYPRNLPIFKKYYYKCFITPNNCVTWNYWETKNETIPYNYNSD